MSSTNFSAGYFFSFTVSFLNNSLESSHLKTTKTSLPPHVFLKSKIQPVFLDILLWNETALWCKYVVTLTVAVVVVTVSEDDNINRKPKCRTRFFLTIWRFLIDTWKFFASLACWFARCKNQSQKRTKIPFRN